MDSQAFLDRVGAYHRDGWRLAIINTTSILPTDEIEGGAFDVSWSFAQDDGRLEHLRERVLPGEEVPSISDYFGAAFLYENEVRELFGINVTGLNLDLQGQLYKTATKVPFSHQAVKARLAATAAAAEAAAAAQAAEQKS